MKPASYIRQLPWRLGIGGVVAVLFGMGVANADGSRNEVLLAVAFMLVISLVPGKRRRNNAHRDPMQDDPGGDGDSGGNGGDGD